MDDLDLRRSRPDVHYMEQVGSNWLRGLKAYLVVSMTSHLVWEFLQLPLYTIWTNGTVREMIFAVIHCTGGDVLIALAALTIALVFVGTKDWPILGPARVMLLTIAVGIGYTIFSEWLNIVIRASWAYSGLMPVVPVIRTGLSPLLQWLVIPSLALTLARKAALQQHKQYKSVGPAPP
jgi:hypothetical protein